MKAIILCDKRTGSTFLQNCLDSHPDLTVYDEMFMIRGGIKKRHGQFLFRHMKNTKGFSPEKYLDWLSNEGENVIFRLIYDHCNKFELDSIIRKRKIPIVHLFRKNHFEKTMSKLTKGLFEPKKVIIPVDKLLQGIKKSEGKASDWTKRWEGYKPQMYIEYKEMIGEVSGDKTKDFQKVGAFNMRSAQTTYLSDDINKKICKFLSIPDFRMSSNITKKNSNNIFDYVKNDGKVRKLLKNKGLEKYLGGKL